jgi:hypothetical protein
MVQMYESSGQLPDSLDALYSYSLGQFLDETAWAEKDHPEYPSALTQLAFTMMAEKRPYDPAKDNLPAPIRIELKEMKLLVDRGTVEEFRHQRILTYLASKHFGRRWQAILTSDKTQVDTNWDVMLQFHVSAVTNPDDDRDLLLLVLKKDMDAAIRLNSWGLQNRPDLFNPWQDIFKKAVGDRVVADSATDRWIGGL